jgi:hypothetical protein
LARRGGAGYQSGETYDDVTVTVAEYLESWLAEYLESWLAGSRA